MRQHRRTHSAGLEQGWTLLELMVTLTVLGITLAAGLPSISTMLANMRVRGAADSLQTGLSIAQAEAMRRSVNVEALLIDQAPSPANASATPLASGRNWIVRIPAAPSLNRSTSEFVRGSTEAQGDAVTYATVAVGAAGVAFTPRGRVGILSGETLNLISMPFVIRVSGTGSDRPLCVFSTLAGTIRTCDPQLNGSDFRGCPDSVRQDNLCVAAS